MYNEKEVIEFAESLISEGYKMNDDGDIFHPVRGLDTLVTVESLLHRYIDNPSSIAPDLWSTDQVKGMMIMLAYGRLIPVGRDMQKKMENIISAFDPVSTPKP